jgi:hypothetical protein
MQPYVREIFDRLNETLIQARITWGHFLQLFGTQEEVDVLNRFAPAAFSVIQGTMARDVILSIARMTDPAETLGPPNATFDRLVGAVENAAESQLATGLKDDLKLIQALCQDLRTMRNKVIAHSAFRPQVITPPHRNEMEDILHRCGAILNRVSEHYGERAIAYDHTFLGLGDGAALIRRLSRLAELEPTP